jgi:hypothetical protein
MIDCRKLPSQPKYNRTIQVGEKKEGNDQPAMRGYLSQPKLSAVQPAKTAHLDSDRHSLILLPTAHQ